MIPNHAMDLVLNGHSIIKVRTVDTDVIILLISVFHRLESEGLQKLWVGFGKGKHYKDIPIHTVSRELAERKCKVLPLFHSLTGCDYMSYFRSVGKLKF